MGLALEGEARFERVLHHEAGAGMGRVGLSVPNLGSGIAWSHDGNTGLVLEGELFDTPALARAADPASGPLPSGDDAALALRVWQQSGREGLARLNGTFCGAIWERREARLTLFTDRLGLFPLYHARVNDGLLFASGVRALLADARLGRGVDAAALSQFVVYDHVLDQRTLLESVRVLPPGGLLSFENGRVTEGRYWQLRYPDFQKAQPEAAWVEQLAHLTRQAVERQKPDHRPAAVLLSGGLDSRIIAGLLCTMAADVQTLTFGIPGCDDARVAAEVARALRTTHHFVELKSDWLRGLAEEGVRVTDGLGNIVNLHVLPAVEEEHGRAQLLYKGFLGDALLGFGVRRQMWADYDPAVRHEVHRGVHRTAGAIAYEPEEQARLFTEGFRSRIGSGPFQAYADAMDRSGARQMANERLHFSITQRSPRMTLHGVAVARRHAVVRLPFADNDLVEFAVTVPPGFMLERHLQKTAFMEQFPRLAQIPLAGSGRPLRSCARDVFVQARTLAKWHLRRHGLGWLTGTDRRPYKNYNLWFRTVLRPWVEGILLDPRTLERGYFEPAFVRALVAAHMAGADHAVRLGALLTIELWHRRFLD